MVAFAQKTDDGFSAVGSFSGNPLTLNTGAVTLKYLQEIRQIYAASFQGFRGRGNEFQKMIQFKKLFRRKNLRI
jgi:glutamate-1-semialdehyde aminotransferase